MHHQRSDQGEIDIREVSADEVRRALTAYRSYNTDRATAIAVRCLHSLLDCPPCLQEYLQPGDDIDEIKDQLKSLCERLKLGF